MSIVKLAAGLGNQISLYAAVNRTCAGNDE